MTVKKQNKVVSKAKETKKVSDLKETAKGALEGMTLGGLFGELDKVIKKTSEELGIYTKEYHDYYISYTYVKDGQLKFDGSAFGTDINPFSKMGLGMRLIQEKLKISEGIDNVVILSVIRLGE